MKASDSAESPGPSASRFAETRWTLVLMSRGGGPEARQALSDLCAAYYSPVVAFLRKQGRAEDEARDVAHDFFARLLGSGQSIASYDPARGRFRSYLLGAVKHFLSDRHDRASASKRGGGVQPVSLDAAPANATDPTTGSLAILDEHATAPDREFDRQWALTLLARSLDTLAREMAVAGKEKHFETLKPWLTGDNGDVRQAAAATELNMSEDALKVAVHRLRKRFRALVKDEIAHTVGSSTDVREELGYLLSVM